MASEVKAVNKTEPRVINSTEVFGGGHGGSTKHFNAIEDKIREIAERGQHETIYGNRALNTAGFNGTEQPDIIAIRRGAMNQTGVKIKADAWEFASPSQARGKDFAELVRKVERMSEANKDIDFTLIRLGEY